MNGHSPVVVRAWSPSVPPGHASSSSTRSADHRLFSDRYRLDRVLGHGGVGIVWQARDLQLGRDVAVKQLQPGLARDPVASERFRREATMAASLVHSSMVTIFDVGEDQQVPYLVMELVDGPPLADVLRTHGALGVDEAVAIGHRIASALAVAHERGLVHRDVKPANVLLSRDGPPRLVDFGTVHVRGEASVELTTPGTMLGTIGYVAPEQLEGEAADARSDVFSLGLVLYECLVGAPAFATGAVAEMTRRRLTDDVPAPSSRRPGVPDDLDDLVVAATRREPGARPSDAGALADALAPFLVESPDRLLMSLAGGAAPAPRTQEAYRPAAPPPDDRPGPTPTDANATSVLPTAAGAGEEPGGVPAPPPSQPATEGTPPSSGSRAAGSSPAGASSRRGLLPVVVLVALGLVAAVFAISALDDGAGREQIDMQATGGNGGDEDDGGSDDELAASAVADASDFDPLDGSNEHPEDIGAAHDGDPSSAWETEGYNSPDLGGLKAGVGMWVRAEEAISQAEVDLAVPGVDVELYALNEPPSSDPGDWGEPIQTWSDAEGTLAVDVPDGNQVLLVWFTAAGPDDDGRYRAGVSDVRLS